MPAVCARTRPSARCQQRHKRAQTGRPAPVRVWLDQVLRYFNTGLLQLQHQRMSAFCTPQADSIPPNRSLWYCLIAGRAEDSSPVMRSERTHLSPFTKDGRDSITIRAFTLFCDTTRVYSNTLSTLLLIPWLSTKAQPQVAGETTLVCSASRSSLAGCRALLAGCSPACAVAITASPTRARRTLLYSLRRDVVARQRTLNVHPAQCVQATRGRGVAEESARCPRMVDPVMRAAVKSGAYEATWFVLSVVAS